MTSRWSHRWRALVDDVDPLRVARGRGYERSGRVTGLRTAPGLLTAWVQGSRATPHLVEVGLPVLDDRDWDRVVRAVAEQARHAARLLAGQAPVGLEDEGVRLFPHPAEIGSSCGCDDPSLWCKHVVAVIEAAARRLDRDPFLLLHLRGRGRERFLADLAAARGGADRPATGLPLAALQGLSWTSARSPLDDLTPPSSGEDPLARLGDPPGWAGGVTAADLFGPLVERGAAWAAQQRSRVD
jgi:uncharacterized Zn finger protein